MESERRNKLTETESRLVVAGMVEWRMWVKAVKRYKLPVTK